MVGLSCRSCPVPSACHVMSSFPPPAGPSSSHSVASVCPLSCRSHRPLVKSTSRPFFCSHFVGPRHSRVGLISIHPSICQILFVCLHVLTTRMMTVMIVMKMKILIAMLTLYPFCPFPCRTVSPVSLVLEYNSSIHLVYTPRFGFYRFSFHSLPPSPIPSPRFPSWSFLPLPSRQKCPKNCSIVLFRSSLSSAFRL